MNQHFPGEDLRLRREELGLSVDDVFRKIRIPTYCIEALEAGDTERLPAPCYAQGFLATYCALLDLETDYYAQRLQACMRPPGRFLIRSGRRGQERPEWLSELSAWAAVCAILILGWIAYTVIVQPTVRDADQHVEAGAIEAPRPEGASRP